MGVRITSGTYADASGYFVKVPVVANASPSRRYPTWSVHFVDQSGCWYQMKKRPCTIATSTISTSARRAVIAGDCSVSSGQLAVERVDVADETIEAVTRDHRCASSITHRL